MKRRTIKAQRLARDIYRRMGDSALMEKYDLTPKLLHLLLMELVKAELITEMELCERTTLTDSLITRAFVDDQECLQQIR
jgi:hypothetical protein